MGEPQGSIDFFISYRGQQTAWALCTEALGGRSINNSLLESADYFPAQDVPSCLW